MTDRADSGTPNGRTGRRARAACAVGALCLAAVAAMAAMSLASRAAGVTAAGEAASEAGLVRQAWFDGAAVGAAALGVAAMAAGCRFAGGRSSRTRWGRHAVTAAAVPVSYLVLYAAPISVSGEVVPVAMLAGACAAAAAYAMALRGLVWRQHYLACVGLLATAAVFFQLWEPPSPAPLPIRKPLASTFPRQIGEWRGEHANLDAATEKVLGADQYLNLQVQQEGTGRLGQVFVTYNASAMSNVPHVPWVCMTNAGYRLVQSDTRIVIVPELGNKEFDVNVLHFKPKPGLDRAPVLMLQYFCVAGTYTTNREETRWLGTTGSLSRHGSYLSQTQVSVWLSPQDQNADPTAKDGPVYLAALDLLRRVAAMLEQQYYPRPVAAAMESPGGANAKPVAAKEVSPSWLER